MVANNLSEKLELHAIAKGTVQGVSFRANVCQLAVKLNVVGFTRNLPNGSVEIVAQGTQEALEQLIDQVKRLPSPIRVSSLEVDYQPPKNLYENFRIRN